jgi:hypothetical protein
MRAIINNFHELLAQRSPSSGSAAHELQAEVDSRRQPIMPEAHDEELHALLADFQMDALAGTETLEEVIGSFETAHRPRRKLKVGDATGKPIKCSAPA